MHAEDPKLSLPQWALQLTIATVLSGRAARHNAQRISCSLGHLPVLFFNHHHTGKASALSCLLWNHPTSTSAVRISHYQTTAQYTSQANNHYQQPSLSPLQRLLFPDDPLPQAKNHDSIPSSQAKPSNRPASQEIHSSLRQGLGDDDKRGSARPNIACLMMADELCPEFFLQ